jgi:YggT family protein
MRRKGYIGGSSFALKAWPAVTLASSRTLRKPLPFRPPAATCGEILTECPMTSLYQILMLILNVAQFFILAQVIMSWLINFQVLNIRQPLVSQIWYGLNRLLEPIYAPVRRVLPAMGGLDLAPLVVLIAIYALQIILRNNIAAFL